ncbi:polysaccharide export protein [Neisseria weaveri]|uniref:polysaccharide export protein n=1 Tax=Neisseria weaveri TaxID=28091 RepID=UPI000D31AB81|nr:polysaccharide export protein [Neisseria weaveri]
MNYCKLTIISLSLLALGTGCTVVPGSSLPKGNKTVVYHEQDSTQRVDLDSKVSIRPITYNLIQSMKQPPRMASNNLDLNHKKSTYRYRIGKGDVLNIMVWHHPDLASKVPTFNPPGKQVSSGTWVDESGYISYPLIGRLHVQGKTIEELQQIITSQLRRYIKNPHVSINVTEFRSQRVTISGAVANAGQQPITNIPVTLLDAIDMAGGVTANADTQNIKWTHNGVDSTVSLQDILQYGDLAQNQLLSHGDIIYVPTNENSKVYVMGEVGKQTALRMSGHGLTLTQALGESGGLNQTHADATGVFVIRNTPKDLKKPIHIYQLNLKDATAYALGNEFKLHAEDIVYITAAPVTRWNRVISQLTNTISNSNSLDNIFKF